jgi:hypothetical protein
LAEVTYLCEEKSGEAVMSESTELLIGVLVFGAVALGVTAAVQIVKGKVFSANFVKLFGLVFIGSLATAIVFAKIDTEARTGAYTILGTIAGYLAGSRVVPTGGGSGNSEGHAGGSAGTKVETSL